MEGLFAGGVITLIVATTVRILTKSSPLSWLYSIFYFGVVVAVFVGCFEATSEEANWVGVGAALSTHLIAYVRTENQGQQQPTRQPPAQRTPAAQPKTQSGQRAPQRPAQQRPAPQRPAQQERPAAPATKVKPVVQDPKAQSAATAAAPKTAPAKQTAANTAAAKTAAVKQTLKTCLRCGKTVQHTTCGYCGKNIASGKVRLLCRIDPRKLQIPKR